MGGQGSGSYYRWGKKTTTFEIKRIDIRYMTKHGLLKPNYQGQLKWTSRGKPSGDIRYSCYTDSLKLDYRYMVNGGDWQPVVQCITFDRTSCNYGGYRLWFLCPRCSKRVAILYGAEKLFLCRHCYQIPYASQNQGYMDNLIDKKHALGKRIFEHYECGDGWGKKKGMHWKTFKVLHRQYNSLEQCWINIVKNHLSSRS
jgi:hypothetical protein